MAQLVHGSVSVADATTVDQLSIKTTCSSIIASVQLRNQDHGAGARGTTAAKSALDVQCRVCSAASTGVHYGVISCEGCKAFFKRAINQYNQHKCYFGGACLITPETRGRCKACRLQRCVSEGMALDGTKFGRGRGLRNVREQSGVQKFRNTSLVPSFPSTAAPVVENSKLAKVSSFPVPIPQSGQTAQDAQQSALRPLVIMRTADVSARTQLDDRAAAADVRAGTESHDHSSLSADGDKEELLRGTIGQFLDNALENELELRNRELVLRNGGDQRSNPTKLSFMSSYLALLMERNKRLEDTIGGVKTAVAFAYRGQIEDWTNNMEKILPYQSFDMPHLPTTTSVDNILISLQENITQDVERLTEFCRVLPGFTELPLREQGRRISSKYTITWMLNRAPYFKNKELFCFMGNGLHHYGRSWMDILLDTQLVDYLFEFFEEINTLNLTLTENYLLMAVVVLQPNHSDCGQYLKFLHSHYLHALTHLLGARCSGLVGRLNSILTKAKILDRIHSRYVSLLDFSKSPVRPVNGTVWSPALLAISNAESHDENSAS